MQKTTALKLPAINHELIVDKVYNILKVSILSNVFTGGEKLNIKDIAAQTGISTTPVRDAINKLAHDGFLTIVPSSGTYVTTLSRDALQDLFNCREILELGAIEAMIATIPVDSVRHLRFLMNRIYEEGQRFRDTLTSGVGDVHKTHYTRFFELDGQFHEAIVAEANNAHLVKMYGSLNLMMHMGRTVYWDYTEHIGERIERIHRDHQAIFSAIEARDLNAAKTALREHIRRWRDFTLRQVDAQNKIANVGEVLV